MKKIFALIVILLAIMPGFAQNANKSGLYFDVGLGYALGNLPVVDIALEESIIKLDYPKSAGLVIDAGYRYTQWKRSAVELKFQYQGTFKKIEPTTILKLMPGYVHFFRMGKGRLLFTEVNAGIAFGSKGLKSARWKESGITSSNITFQKPGPGLALYPMSIGLGYGLEAGITLGKIFSISAAWDAQILKQYSSTGLKARNWGLASLKFGVRL